MIIKRPKPKQYAPKNAKKVFKGLIFDVYHWEQKLYDGSFTTFEKIRRKDTAQVIPVTEDNKIILLWQKQSGFKSSVYSVAGGQVDPGESPLEAAKRELLEETGHKAKEMELWFSSQPHVRMDWASYTFIARGCKKVSGLALDPGEKIKLKYVNFEKFIKIAFSENFYDREITLQLLKEGLDWKTCLKGLTKAGKKFGLTK